MITREQAEAYRDYYEAQAVLYDSLAAKQTSRSMRAAAAGIRDHAYGQFRKYDRLYRSRLRRWFTRAPR